jgi:hypothetical protein
MIVSAVVLAILILSIMSGMPKLETPSPRLSAAEQIFALTILSLSTIPIQ